ncbi:MAG: DUF389 domain-containing protein, partial [Microcystaceae cyanobacterium]
LLVAAMLIAPFAGPAMNTAIATAWGDRKLLWRSILRYFAALSVTTDESGLHNYGTALWWTAMLITTMGSEY